VRTVILGVAPFLSFRGALFSLIVSLREREKDERGVDVDVEASAPPLVASTKNGWRSPRVGVGGGGKGATSPVDFARCEGRGRIVAFRTNAKGFRRGEEDGLVGDGDEELERNWVRGGRTARECRCSGAGRKASGEGGSTVGDDGMEPRWEGETGLGCVARYSASRRSLSALSKNAETLVESMEEEGSAPPRRSQ